MSQHEPVATFHFKGGRTVMTERDRPYWTLLEPGTTYEVHPEGTVRRLVDALGFYADRDNYKPWYEPGAAPGRPVMHDDGAIARRALTPTDSEVDK